MDAYVDYVFNKSVAQLFEGFYAGFHKVCGGRVLDLFQPSELQAMIIGNTNYDWTELEKVPFHNLPQRCVNFFTFSHHSSGGMLASREL